MKNRTHIYFDEYLDRYSNVALGLIIRALGYNLKIAYFNSRTNQLKLIEFFRNFENIDFFFDDYIPDKLNYDLIIFDNCNFDTLKKNEIIDMIKNKNSEYVFTFSVQEEYVQLKDSFDLVSEYEYEDNNLGKENITNISGDGKGKSTWCLGEIIRNLIKEKKVKLIYFDKGGDIYGERFFFEKLKDKNLDIVVTGTQRFDGKTFRFENQKQDFSEAKKGLNELENSKNYNLIIADELNTTINSNLLQEKYVLDIIKDIDTKLIISGRYVKNSILKLCYEQIDVKHIKHYSKLSSKAKQGIDY